MITGLETEGARPLVVHVCPGCGEQITESVYTSERGTFYGHYHDPPEDWPHNEDPWFDAIAAGVVLESERDLLQARVETLEAVARAVDAHYSASLDYKPPYVAMARAALEGLGDEGKGAE